MNPIDPKEAREKIMATMKTTGLYQLQALGYKDVLDKPTAIASYFYACMMAVFPLTPSCRTHLRGNYELESARAALYLADDKPIFENIKQAFIVSLTKQADYYYSKKDVEGLDSFYQAVTDNFTIGVDYYANLLAATKR